MSRLRNSCAAAALLLALGGFASAQTVGNGIVGGGGGSGTVSSISNSDSTLTLSPNPITGVGTISLNLNNANIWTANQAITETLNGTVSLAVTNSATGGGGTTASARLQAFNDSGHAIQLIATSSGFIPTGVFLADQGVISWGGGGGLYINSGNASGPLTLAANGQSGLTLAANTGYSTISGASMGAASTNSALTVNATWNDAGTTFKGALLVNVTNTNSNTASLLADFQVGGVSQFNISRAGVVTTTGTINSGASIATGATGQLRLNMSSTILTSPSPAVIQLGAADAAAPVAQTLGVQNVVAGTSNVAGANWTINASAGTGTGIGGNIIFQGAPHSTTGSTQNALTPILTLNGDTKGATFSGQLNVSAMTQTSVAQSGTACYNSGTGAVTYDATLGCLASLPELKDIRGPISNTFAVLDQIKPIWFSWKHSTPEWKGGDHDVQAGLNAREIAAIPLLGKNLTARDERGNLRGVRYMEMAAFNLAVEKDLKALVLKQDSELRDLRAANDNLTRRVAALEHRR